MSTRSKEEASLKRIDGVYGLANFCRVGQSRGGCSFNVTVLAFSTRNQLTGLRLPPIIGQIAVAKG